MWALACDDKNIFQDSKQGQRDTANTQVTQRPRIEANSAGLKSANFAAKSSSGSLKRYINILTEQE